MEAVYERTSLNEGSILLRFVPTETVYFSDGYLRHFSNINIHLIGPKGDRIIGKEHVFFKAEETFYSLTKRASLVAAPHLEDPQIPQNQEYPSVYSLKEIQYKIIYK